MGLIYNSANIISPPTSSSSSSIIINRTNKVPNKTVSVDNWLPKQLTKRNRQFLQSLGFKV